MKHPIFRKKRNAHERALRKRWRGRERHFLDGKRALTHRADVVYSSTTRRQAGLAHRLTSEPIYTSVSHLTGVGLS